MASCALSGEPSRRAECQYKVMQSCPPEREATGQTARSNPQRASEGTAGTTASSKI